MNSKLRQQAQAKLTAVTAQLDGNRLKVQIDDPIDQVLRNYRYQTITPVDVDTFNQLISNFYQTLYTDALKMGWFVQHPLGQAIRFIEDNYQGLYAKGYVAARLDINDLRYGGISFVLTNLAETIKNSHRQLCLQGVFTALLDSSNWELRCAMAELLLDEYHPFLPSQLQQAEPAQLADDIQLLLQIYHGSSVVVQKMA